MLNACSKIQLNDTYRETFFIKNTELTHNIGHLCIKYYHPFLVEFFF